MEGRGRGQSGCRGGWWEAESVWVHSKHARVFVQVISQRPPWVGSFSKLPIASCICLSAIRFRATVGSRVLLGSSRLFDFLRLGMLLAALLAPLSCHYEKVANKNA